MSKMSFYKQSCRIGADIDSDGLAGYAKVFAKTISKFKSMKEIAPFPTMTADSQYQEVVGLYASLTRVILAARQSGHRAETAEWSDAVGKAWQRVLDDWDADPTVTPFRNAINNAKETGQKNVMPDNKLFTGVMVKKLEGMQEGLANFRQLLTKRDKMLSETTAYKVLGAVNAANPFTPENINKVVKGAGGVTAEVAKQAGKTVAAGLSGLFTKPMLIFGGIAGGGYLLYKLIEAKYRDPNVKRAIVQYKK